MTFLEQQSVSITYNTAASEVHKVKGAIGADNGMKSGSCARGMSSVAAVRCGPVRVVNTGSTREIEFTPVQTGATRPQKKNT